ncbi:MAG: prepilin peptidase, partial [Wenzhouxiangellaceae bacterium]
MESLALLHPAALYTLVVVFGLLIGSFLNVVILRVPEALFHKWRCQ